MSKKDSDYAILAKLKLDHTKYQFITQILHNVSIINVPTIVSYHQLYQKWAKQNTALEDTPWINLSNQLILPFANFYNPFYQSTYQSQYGSVLCMIGENNRYF